MNIKLIGKVFLFYFGLLALFIIACWIKYIYSLNLYGGEMGDVILLFGLSLATIYLTIFTIWTYRITIKSDTRAIRIQLFLIFLFGICLSVIFFFL